MTHSVVVRYQKFLAQAEGASPADLALAVGGCYGTPDCPTGAGVEARALSQVLGCAQTQDAVEIFISLTKPEHLLRQRLRDYLQGL